MTCGATRRSDGHHGFWHGHVSALIAAAGAEAETDFVAHVLLDAVTGDLVQHLLARGMSPERIGRGAAALAVMSAARRRP
jgi:hypothetical protein